MSGVLFAQLLILLVVAGLFFAVAAREHGAEQEKETWKGRLKLEQYEQQHWLERYKVEQEGYTTNEVEKPIIRESPTPRYKWEGDEP